MSLYQQKSKEDLEKIYNKGQLFRQKQTQDEFTLKAIDVKKFNDRVMQDKILNDEYEDENPQPCSEYNQNNIEVLTLLSEQKPSLSKRYIQPILKIDRRITLKKSVLGFILLLTIGYLVIRAVMIIKSST